MDYREHQLCDVGIALMTLSLHHAEVTLRRNVRRSCRTKLASAWSCVMFASALASGAAIAAPDEDALGRSEGYPCRKHVDEPILGDKYSVCTNSNWDAVFAAARVKAPLVARPLIDDPNAPAIRWQQGPSGSSLSVEDFLQLQPITGMLILQGDHIAFERYQYDRKSDQKFTSFSMAKTLTGLLVGAALKDGAIRSLDDTAGQYVPELRESAYAEVTIRNLLHMGSGVKWDEGPSVMMGSDIVRRFTDATLRRKGAGGASTVNWLKDSMSPQGTRFNYAGPDTEVLALVVRSATGKPLSQYLSEKIWAPMGAEGDASWVTDRAGVEIGYAFFNARLRDYGRLGLFLAEDLTRGDQSAVTQEFLLDATSADRQPDYLKPRMVSRRYFGYGYQIWLLPYKTRTFALVGSYGQRVIVQPEHRVVIAYTSAQRTQSATADIFRQEIAFVDGVLRSLGAAADLLPMPGAVASAAH